MRKEHSRVTNTPRVERTERPGGEPDFAPSSETPGGYVWQAALKHGSSMGCWQAAPGNVSAQCFAHRVYFLAGIQRPIELPHLETFPGAAYC
jgi:hypothetical protein